MGYSEILKRSFDRGLHITTNEKLRNQTWEDFYEGVENKKSIYMGSWLSCRSVVLQV